MASLCFLFASVTELLLAVVYRQSFKWKSILPLSMHQVMPFLWKGLITKELCFPVNVNEKDFVDEIILQYLHKMWGISVRLNTSFSIAYIKT